MKYFSLGLLFLFNQAALATNCSYEVFTPKFLLEKLKFELREKQVATYNNNGNIRIVRDGGFVGDILSAENQNKTDNLLILSDNRGLNLLTVHEEAKGVGRREIKIESGFEKYPSLSSLLVMKIQGGGTYHYLGVQDLGITTFYNEFRDFWNKMMGALLEDSTPVLPEFKSQEERFQFSLQTDPSVVPYIKLISLIKVKGKHAVVGAVPSNFVFNRVLALAQQTFGPAVRVNLSINGLLKQELIVAPRCK